MQHYIRFNPCHAAKPAKRSQFLMVRVFASSALLLAGLVAGCAGSIEKIVPSQTTQKAETGAPIKTILTDSGSTSADFIDLGGNSRAIRGAVANNYWTGIELLTDKTYHEAVQLSGFGEGRLMATSSQTGYAPLPSTVKVGSRFYVFQVGKQYYDMQMRQNLGYEAVKIAEATVTANTAGRAVLLFADAIQEIKVGDLVLPAQRNQAQVVAARPQIDLSGRIIATVGDSSRIGPQQVVTLNLGDFDNIKPGHLLGVYSTDTTPTAATQIGELVVVRVYGTLSYAVITRVRREIPIGAQVANPATSL